MVSYPPLSSTHTPGTQAPVASLSVALSLSGSLEAQASVPLVYWQAACSPLHWRNPSSRNPLPEPLLCWRHAAWCMRLGAQAVDCCVGRNACECVTCVRQLAVACMSPRAVRAEVFLVMYGLHTSLGLTVRCVQLLSNGVWVVPQDVSASVLGCAGKPQLGCAVQLGLLL
jgi:hypothetical protein